MFIEGSHFELMPKIRIIETIFRKKLFLLNADKPNLISQLLEVDRPRLDCRQDSVRNEMQIEPFSGRSGSAWLHAPLARKTEMKTGD